MDINLQYSQHQQSLMRAMTSVNGAVRMRHLESAGSVAKRIEAWQRAEGANAAHGWSLVTNDNDLAEFPNERTPV